MMSLKNIINFLLVTVFLWISAACTDFGGSGDEIDSKTKSVLKGKINLNDSDDNSGVYIYLDGFDKYTISDSDGNFELEIDPPRSQPGGGITGAFPLYLYIDNYEMRRIDIPVTHGEFAYGQAGINSHGEFKSELKMIKMLDISTSVSPAQISRNYVGNLDIKVFITNLVDTVLISTKADKSKSFAGAFFINHLQKDNIHLMQANGILRAVYLTEPEEWHMFLQWDSTGVSPGEYEVIPFIKVIHLDMPQGLKNILGNGASNFTKDFLNVPNTYQTTSITIVDDSN